MRINVLRDAVPLLLAPVMPRFTERFPLVEIEVSVDDHFVNVTAEGFDAGLRYSGTIPEDMIAAQLTGPLGWVAVASPAYVARKGLPQSPDELADHEQRAGPDAEGGPVISCAVRCRLAAETPENLGLQRVGILELIDQHMGEARRERAANNIVVTQQASRRKDQIVEI